MIDIESDHQHIMSFIDGFESMIKQYRENGSVNIGGMEGYSVGVLRANSLQYDVTKGFENFIVDGIKKLCEMISDFFKAIWNFFFGSDKKAAKAEEDAKETKVKVSKVKKAVNETPSNPSTDIDYSRIKKINAHGKRIKELLDKVLRYMEGSDQASKHFEEAAGNLDSGELPPEYAKIFEKLKSVSLKIKKDCDKLNTIAPKIKELKVPEGNRLDKSATSKILSLVDSYMIASIDAISSSRALLTECENSYDLVFKIVKGEGFNDEQGRSFLRVIQIGQKVFASRLKWMTRTVTDIKTEIDSLNILLEKKD